MAKVAALGLTGALGLTIAVATVGATDPPGQTQTVTVTRTETVRQLQMFQKRPAVWWAKRTWMWKRRALAFKRQWKPTVDYALRLAAAVSGVPYWQLRSVSWCESRHWPFAVNGRYKGIFQMWWLPFGFSQFDPVASALSAALTVRNDGGWRQWECKP